MSSFDDESSDASASASASALSRSDSVSTFGAPGATPSPRPFHDDFGSTVQFARVEKYPHVQVLLANVVRRKGGLFGKWKKVTVCIGSVDLKGRGSRKDASRDDENDNNDQDSLTLLIRSKAPSASALKRAQGHVAGESAVGATPAGSRSTAPSSQQIHRRESNADFAPPGPNSPVTPSITGTDAALSAAILSQKLDHASAALVKKIEKSSKGKAANSTSQVLSDRDVLVLSECRLQLASSIVGEPHSIGLFPKGGKPWFLLLGDEGRLVEWAVALRPHCASTELSWSASESLEAYFLDPTLIASDRGVITNANEALLRLLGWSRDELVGKRVEVLMPENVAKMHASIMRRYNLTGSKALIGNPRPLPVQTRDGQQFRVLLCLSEEVLNGERRFVCNMRPLPEPAMSRQSSTPAYVTGSSSSHHPGGPGVIDFVRGGDSNEHSSASAESSIEEGGKTEHAVARNVSKNTVGSSYHGSGSSYGTASSEDAEEMLFMIGQHARIHPECITHIERLLRQLNDTYTESSNDFYGTDSRPAFSSSSSMSSMIVRTCHVDSLLATSEYGAAFLNQFAFWYENSLRDPSDFLEAVTLVRSSGQRNQNLAKLSIAAHLLELTDKKWLDPPLTADESRDIRREFTLVKKLGSYVPRLLHRRLYNNANPIRPPEVEAVHACVMFADISGYTALSERMVSLGTGAVGELSEQLNSYFDALIEVIHDHGGDVIAFAGDALLVVWPAPNLKALSGSVLLGCQCAQALLTKLCDYQVRVRKRTAPAHAHHASTAVSVSTPLPSLKSNDNWSVSLTLHIGMGAGEIAAISVSDSRASRCTFFVGGSVLDQVADCTRAASPGECVVSEAAWGLVSEYGSEGHDHSKKKKIRVVSGTKRSVGVQQSTTVKMMKTARRHGRPDVSNGYLLQKVHLELATEPPQSMLIFKNIRSQLEKYVEPVVLQRVEAETDEELANEEKLWDRQKRNDGHVSKAPLLRSVGEVRYLTVIFVGFLDPFRDDQVANLQATIGTCMRVIREFDGMLRQFMVDDKGPVLIIAFGTPQASHADDHIRAVNASIHLHRALTVPFSAGIASGNCFVGDVGSFRRREFGIVGDVVNHAARLMGSAAALSASGESKSQLPIFVDEETRKHTSGNSEFFDWRQVGSLKLKGKAEPSPTFSPVPRLFRQAPVQTETTLVGRADEVALIMQLADCYAPLTHPRVSHNGEELDKKTTRLLFFEGETGSGKTALVAVLSREFKEANAQVFACSGSQQDAQTPFAPFRDLLARLATVFGEPAMSQAASSCIPRDVQVSDLVTDILSELRSAPNARALSQQESHDQFQSFVLAVLRDVVPTRSALLFTDTHWFDYSSWRMLHMIMTSVPGLLLCATTLPRTEEDQGPLRLLLHNENTYHAPLIGLGLQDTDALCSTILGGVSVPKVVALSVFERSGGNPFVIGKLVEHLRAHGAISVSNGQCHVNVGNEELATAMPTGVAGLLTATLDTLSALDLRLIKIASVLGDRITLSLVCKIAARGASFDDGGSPSAESLSERDAAACFDRMADMKLLILDEDTKTFAFANTLTRDVVSQLMLHSHRRIVHAQVARVIYDEHGDDPRHWPSLAHHLEHAESPMKIVFLSRCAHQYLDSYETMEALSFLQRAYHCLQNYGSHVPDESVDSVLSTIPFVPEQFSPVSLDTVQIIRRLGVAYQRIRSLEAAHDHFLLALQHLGIDLPSPFAVSRIGKIAKIKTQKWKYVPLDADRDLLIRYLRYLERDGWGAGDWNTEAPALIAARVLEKRRHEAVLCLLKLTEVNFLLRRRSYASELALLTARFVNSDPTALFPSRFRDDVLVETHAMAAMACGLRIKASHRQRASDAMFVESKRHLEKVSELLAQVNFKVVDYSVVNHYKRALIWQGMFLAGHAHAHAENSLASLRHVHAEAVSRLPVDRPLVSDAQPEPHHRTTWGRSISSFRKAFKLAKQIGDTDFMELCLLLRGEVHVLAGDLEGAAECLESSRGVSSSNLAIELFASRLEYLRGDLAASLQHMHTSSLLFDHAMHVLVANSDGIVGLPSPSPVAETRRGWRKKLTVKKVALSQPSASKSGDKLALEISLEAVQWLLQRAILYHYSKDDVEAWKHFSIAFSVLERRHVATSTSTKLEPSTFVDFRLYTLGLEFLALAARDYASWRSHAPSNASDPPGLPSLLHISNVFAKLLALAKSFSVVFSFTLPRINLWEAVLLAAEHKFDSAEAMFLEAYKAAVSLAMPGEVCLILVERYRCYASPKSSAHAFFPVARGLKYEGLCTSASLEDDVETAKRLCSFGAGAVRRFTDSASLLESVGSIPARHRHIGKKGKKSSLHVSQSGTSCSYDSS